MTDGLTAAVTAAANFVWGPWTIALLLGTGVFLSLRYGFIQVRRLPEALALLRRPGGATGGPRGTLSPFQAFMTGLGASTGTGNIAGVATAIVTGGPGALFWIWCYGFFAAVIKLTEAMLAQRFRTSVASAHGERLLIGPMTYLERGIGSRRLALVYAGVAGIAALTTTPFTQPNSVAVVFESVLGVPTWATGLAMTILVFAVVIGGVKSIGRVASRLAPTMVALYFAAGLVVIVAHAGAIPATLALVFREAFSFGAAAGAASGVGIMVAMRYGVARGIYANEAGYGTAAVAYGTAASDRPAQQGLNAMVEVYIVSFVTSSVSALTILLTGAWRSGLKSTAVVAQAFGEVIPSGGYLVLLCALLFGCSTLIGWGYYGEQFLSYLLGPRVVLPYRLIYCGLVIVGATTSVELVWSWGDLMNGLQIFPNLIGVLGLSGLVATMLREDAARASRATRAAR